MARGKSKDLAKVWAARDGVMLPAALTGPQHNLLCAIKNYLQTHILPWSWTATYNGDPWINMPHGCFDIEGEVHSFIPGVGMCKTIVTAEFDFVDFDNSIIALQDWVNTVCAYKKEQETAHEMARRAEEKR